MTSGERRSAGVVHAVALVAMALIAVLAPAGTLPRPVAFLLDRGQWSVAVRYTPSTRPPRDDRLRHVLLTRTIHEKDNV